MGGKVFMSCFRSSRSTKCLYDVRMHVSKSAGIGVCQNISRAVGWRLCGTANVSVWKKGLTARLLSPKDCGGFYRMCWNPPCNCLVNQTIYVYQLLGLNVKMRCFCQTPAAVLYSTRGLKCGNPLPAERYSTRGPREIGKCLAIFASHYS